MKKILDIAKSTLKKLADNAIVAISISKIHLNDELKEVFKMEEAVRDRIAEDMKKNGFSKSHPIHVFWFNGMLILIDGYTRYAAALLAGLTTVYVQIHNFETIEEAKLFSMKEQINRRNMTDAMLYNQYLAILEESNGTLTAEEAGKQLQKSRRTMTKFFKIQKNATPQQIEDIKSSKTSINQVYNQIMQKEADEKAKIEEQEKQEIHEQQIAECINDEVLDQVTEEDVEAKIIEKQQKELQKKQRELDEKETEIAKKEHSTFSKKEIFTLAIHFAYMELAKGHSLQDILDNSLVQNITNQKSLDAIYNEIDSNMGEN